MLESAGEARMTHLRQVIEMHDSLYPHLATRNAGKVKVLRREVGAAGAPTRGGIGQAALPAAGTAFTAVQPEHFGLISVRSAHAGKDATVFARVVFTVAQTGPLTVHYGTDAPVKVWLNGQVIDTRAEVSAAMEPAQYHATHTARAGENEAVFAISSHGGKASGVIPSCVLG
jgi:hypothetical protein